MPSELSQLEADTLLAMAKRRDDNEVILAPAFGGTINVRLLSIDGREEFFLDLSQGRVSLSKFKFQNRARRCFVLARIDFGAPHRNPNGDEVSSPHLHLYREGFGDKWAYPLPIEFDGLSSKQEIYDQFCVLCNVIEPPQVSFGFH